MRPKWRPFSSLPSPVFPFSFFFFFSPVFISRSFFLSLSVIGGPWTAKSIIVPHLCRATQALFIHATLRIWRSARHPSEENLAFVLLEQAAAKPRSPEAGPRKQKPPILHEKLLQPSRPSPILSVFWPPPFIDTTIPPVVGVGQLVGCQLAS